MVQSVGWICKWEDWRQRNNQQWSQDENSVIFLVKLESIHRCDWPEYITVSKKLSQSSYLTANLSAQKNNIPLGKLFYNQVFSNSKERVSQLVSIVNKGLHLHSSLFSFQSLETHFRISLMGKWNQYLQRDYQVLHLIFTTRLQFRYYFPHFTVVAQESQRDQVIYTRKRNWYGARTKI